MKKILLVLFLIPHLTLAQQNNIGDSPYFINHEKWNCEKYQNRFGDQKPKGLAFIWNTPGTKTRCLQLELQRPELMLVEIALANETCVSRGDCASYEILRGYTTRSLQQAIDKADPRIKKSLQENSKKSCDLVRTFGNVNLRLLINPLLETRMPRKTFAKAATWVKEACPKAEIVWNPVGGNPGAPQAPATISEGHGDAPRFVDNNCIANPDGTVIGKTKQQWEAYFRKYKNCIQVFHWGLNDNCNVEGGKRLDPRKRECKVTEDYKPVAAAMRAAQTPQVLPGPWTPEEDLSKKGCSKIYKAQDGVKKGFVMKESDSKKLPNGKNATVLLFPKEFKRFRDANISYKGKTLDKLDFVYFYTEDSSQRAVYKSHFTPDDLPFNVVVRGRDDRNRIHCWPIANPKLRND